MNTGQRIGLALLIWGWGGYLSELIKSSSGEGWRIVAMILATTGLFLLVLTKENK